MTALPNSDPPTPSRVFAGASALRGVLWLIAGVTLTRILYLALLCPYELAADEAQYWDWSRRLDWSYYSKGPGIAWLIAGARAVLGEAEWAIRTPAALSGAVTMLAVALLARSMAPSSPRAAWYGALAVLAVPAYHATSTFMTIDGPYIACWALACLLGWKLLERDDAGSRPGAPASRVRLVALCAALGLALGVGFLLKYTIALLVPGLIVAAMLRREARARRMGALMISLIVAAAVSAPVFIWNARHDWPTLAHLLGHVNAAGGDTRSSGASYDPRWTLDFLGTQAGIIGPVLLAMVVAWLMARRATGEQAAHDRRAATFALATFAPIAIFYLAVSFTSDAEANWPIAGYIGPLALVGVIASRELPRIASARRAWRATPDRPRAGIIRRAPESVFQIAWDWSIAYGVCAAIGVASLALLDRVPMFERAIPLHRISGHRDWAAKVQQVIDAAAPLGSSGAAGAPPPIVIADQYTRAALLAYYLPSRPSVCSATSFLGGRRSSYDFFPDTNLRDPALLGRAAVLVGSTPERWNAAMTFDRVEPRLSPPEVRWPVYLGVNFAGPRHVGPAPSTASPQPAE